MTKQPLTLDEFTSIYSKVPRLTVELCIIKDKSIALSKRAIEPCVGQWHIPGGTVYFGETIFDAIHRIAKEECGVEVEIGDFIGNIEYPRMHEAGYFGQPIGLAYKLRIISGELRNDEQADEIRLFDKIPDNIIADQKAFFDTHQKLLL